MSDRDNLPPGSEALERTLNEPLAAETVLDGRNGRHIQAVVEQVLSGFAGEPQLTLKLQSETRMGFGMALGKFLAWRAWTETEKSDKRRAAAKATRDCLTLVVSAFRLEEVKSVRPGWWCSLRVGCNGVFVWRSWLR